MFCGICGWRKGIRFEIQFLSAISSSFNFSRNEMEPYTLMTQYSLDFYLRSGICSSRSRRPQYDTTISVSRRTN